MHFTSIMVLILSAEFGSFGYAGRMVPLKILDETINYDPGNSEFGDPAIPEARNSYKPANFSGPDHFRALMGKCYSWADSKYKYNFCPFNNITQSELVEAWNSYKGTLGIWGEWVVQGNHFAAMRMVQGDSCGDKERSTLIRIECGDLEELKEVVEPGAHCMYEGVFLTPLACHEHSLLVYPRLPSSDLRSRWDALETGLFNGDISEKEYSKALEDIFREAGYLLRLDNGEMIPLRSDRTISHSPSGANHGVSHCQAEIHLLRQQLEEMRKELQKLKTEQRNSVT